MDSIMDDLKIIGSLKAEMRDTIGYDADELIEKEELENLKRYEGELIGDERFGRSLSYHQGCIRNCRRCNAILYACILLK